MSDAGHLQALATAAEGLHYNSPEAKKILDAGDWQGYWPVVDRQGILTGDITDSEGAFANVDDLAMISFDDLTPAQRREVEDEYWDGYITLC